METSRPPNDEPPASLRDRRKDRTRRMIQAEALPGAEVLATVTLPWVAPELAHSIGSHFAQIISDPPAETPGTDPGLVIHTYGKGKAVWPRLARIRTS